MSVRIAFALTLAVTCGAAQAGTDLSSLHLPPGFSVSIFADGVKGARSIAIGEKGTVFVGSVGEGKVYAIENDGTKATKVDTIASGLNEPNGVAVHDGALYVAEIGRISRYDAIESHLAAPPRPIPVYDKLPTERHHGWKVIHFAPDGQLYVAIGSPCNVCEPEPPHGTISRLKPDSSSTEIYAKGIRNSVGFDWDPHTKELWFTDNGRDMLGDDLPSDELNHAPKAGMDFGFPYCHQGDSPDPQFGKQHACSEFTPPAAKLGAHVASLGMRFYTGSMFPAEYRDRVFIAEHGSWNRSTKVGYRVVSVKIEGGKAVEMKPFLEGFLDEATDSAWGRPVDVQVMPDGALLVSDDKNGAIYRISYRK